MGTIWVRDLTGGLDTRRMPETTAGGALMLARDGHINSGKEFEQRAAFVKTYNLPAGVTQGLGKGKRSVYVFGHDVAPSLPAGVAYQRLQHPDGGGLALKRVLSHDLFLGKLYVVAEFEDGSVYHFYDGVRVDDWDDGRARATFEVTGGSVIAAVAAQGSFEITGGSQGTGNAISTITVDGVAVIDAPVSHTGSNVATAAAVADAINDFTSNPDYTAISSGAQVIITAVDVGVVANGRVLAVVDGGNVTTSTPSNFAGGVDAIPSRLTGLTVNGVSVIDAAVEWRTSHAATAAAIAAAVNAGSSSPEYIAVSYGAKVTVISETPGTGPNGYAVVTTTANGMTVSPAMGLVLAAGAAVGTTTYQSGEFVKTVGKKVYALTGSVMHFSAVTNAVGWLPADTGAGFIDMASEIGGAEDLVAIGKYVNNVAVFAEGAIIIYFVDPDPDLNSLKQVLENTGTGSALSVAGFGDNDLFYLDESGLRSLRARDSSNAAATTDIGSAVDTLIKAKVRSLTPEERKKIVGRIEPGDGRFWLVLKDEIFVFSFFPGSDVRAWSTYLPTYIDENGDTQTFEIDEALVFNKRVHLRSGDTIFVYGGLGDTFIYDATEPEAWLPYLDAETPTRKKTLTGLDVACECREQSFWEVAVGMQPTDTDASDVIAKVSKTTYNLDQLPAQGEATHFSLRFKGKGAGYKKISSAVMHYQGDDEEKEQ